MLSTVGANIFRNLTAARIRQAARLQVYSCIFCDKAHLYFDFGSQRYYHRGLIAIAVLLQVNININVGERNRRSVKGASAANINVYDVEQPQQSQSLNNQTMKGQEISAKAFSQRQEKYS